MVYFSLYKTPSNFSDLRLESDGNFITALLFLGSKDSSKGTMDAIPKDDLPVFSKLRDWLDSYFRGENPKPFSLFKMHPQSDFQRKVYEILLTIPYGETLTYGDIAKILTKKSGKKMSAQAVGGAVGKNPLCLYLAIASLGKMGSLLAMAEA